MSERWTELFEEMRGRAQEMHAAREIALGRCRSAIQVCSKSIRQLHRHRTDEARELLTEAHKLIEEAREPLRPFPELYHAGYLQDAEKELVEAAVMSAMISDSPYPTADCLGVGLMAYMHGVAEAASEARRYLLDELRAGRAERAEQILQQMETIYDDLITFDFPDGMTGNLRRTTDALRAVIERTRSDLTATVVQQRLIEELRSTQEALEGR
jgi:translin